MKIGAPRKTKDGERRVGMTPAGTAARVAAGHAVRLQSEAGAATGFADTDYRNADAGFAAGLQVHAGHIVQAHLAHDTGRAFLPQAAVPA